MTRADILAEASRIVTTDRNNQYGEPEVVFSAISGHWTWWLQDKLRPGSLITDHDVAQMMVGFKQARAKGNPAHMDSFLDQCGYSAIAGELAARACSND